MSNWSGYVGNNMGIVKTVEIPTYGWLPVFIHDLDAIKMSKMLGSGLRGIQETDRDSRLGIVIFGLWMPRQVICSGNHHCHPHLLGQLWGLNERMPPSHSAHRNSSMLNRWWLRTLRCLSRSRSLVLLPWLVPPYDFIFILNIHACEAGYIMWIDAMVNLWYGCSPNIRHPVNQSAHVEC